LAFLLFWCLEGVGLVEEMPISAFPLYVAEPKVVSNEERNFRFDDADDDSGLKIIDKILQ
jgi:hypothetical protein